MNDETALTIRCVVPPSHPGSLTKDLYVPRRFKHLFWNADLKKLNTRDSGPAISIIEQNDPQALAWAIRNLDKEAFEVAARPRRGLPRK